MRRNRVGDYTVGCVLFSHLFYVIARSRQQTARQCVEEFELFFDIFFDHIHNKVKHTQTNLSRLCSSFTTMGSTNSSSSLRPVLVRRNRSTSECSARDAFVNIYKSIASLFANCNDDSNDTILMTTYSMRSLMRAQHHHASRNRCGGANVERYYNTLMHMTHLDLSHVRNHVNLQRVDLTLLSKFRSLVSLDMSHNRLVRIPTLHNANLQTLRLAHNRIELVSCASTFYSCQPKILDLSYNLLTKFVCKNVTFDILDISHNDSLIQIDAQAKQIITK